MKYRASEIVKRALNLADLANTDFISNDEQIEYLNDSWKEFYQLLINKGDKQFVKEVELYPTNGFGVAEYPIPSDLYQIQSIRNNNGSIITRRAESESLTSGKYEIINDTIRLYGVGGNIIMTYYTVPEFITIPDKTILSNVPYSEISGLTNSISNSFLNTDDSVYNVVTSEKVADLNGSGTLIGNKLVVRNNSLYDFDGNNLNVDYSNTNGESYLIDSHNCKYLKITGTDTFKFINNTVNSDAYRGIIFSDGNILALKDSHFYINGNELPLTPKDVSTQYLKSFGDHEFAILGGYVFEYYNGNVQGYEEIANNGVYLFTSKYGTVIYDGEVKVVSGLPDTEFNFPNELYIQVLSASLAVKYAMKQNADVAGLNNLYDNYKSNFLNSLSQDVGFTRITNVYGV
jgi:hypothetical protein